MTGIRRARRVASTVALASVLALTACGTDETGDNGDVSEQAGEQTAAAQAPSTTTRTVTVTEEPDGEAPEAEPELADAPLNPQAVGTWMRSGLNVELDEAGSGTLGTSNGAANTARYAVSWSGESSAITIEVLGQTDGTGDGDPSSSVQTGSTLSATVEGDQMFLEGFNGPGTRLPVCKDTGDYSDWAC